ncbi:hypothetical protein [Parasphingorhabdus sp.]|uniref:hypothetical protein n=1 Tax=Parasphingorhabdus sp. TaxID=2709688 RepID=UPI002F923524
MTKAEDVKQAAKATVKRIYGDAPDSSSPEAAAFNRLFNARLGRKSIWVKVGRTFVARPSQNNYTNNSKRLSASKHIPALRD